jgi:hypothetical protein
MKPLLIGAALLGVWAWPSPAGDLTPYQQLGLDIYRELIETDTSHSSGDTTKVAELLAKRFRAAGFLELDVQVIGPEAKNRNLLVRYRGTGAKSPMVLLAHLDVVEAKRDDWSLDPFKLTEKDGFFMGAAPPTTKMARPLWPPRCFACARTTFSRIAT